MPVRIEIGALSHNYYVVTRIIARHLSVCLNDHLDLVNHIQRTLLGKKIKTGGLLVSSYELRRIIPKQYKKV